MAKNKSKPSQSSTIAVNKSARHEYFVMEEYKAGVALEGWEVKSMREGRVHLKESYVLVRGGEVFLTGVHITPLQQASTHVVANPVRDRKLLLNRDEINHLMGSSIQQGFTIVALNLFWNKGRVKTTIALGKGKKLHDKRETLKRREWDREKQRIMKSNHS